MVDRWEGILRACFSGSNCPARVMASVLISPHSRTLQQPSKNVILFMGDCVPGSGNPTVERLSRLETVSAILLSKLGDPLANIWVVEASRFNGPFACYEGFLSSLSSCGEPLTYDPHNFPSSRATISMFLNSLAQILQMNKDDKKTEADEKNRTQEKCRRDFPRNIPKTLLFGFSKGGVLLNQLLAEMSHVAKKGQGVVDTSQNKEWVIEIQEAVRESWPSEQALCPTTVDEFLASIVGLHFLDVGLNCPGAYLTDVDVLENVVKAAATSSSGLHMGFHGTPRQWKDATRPWIANEKCICIKYLRAKAEELDNAKLVVSERLYFEHRKPSLQMHFEILECFEMVH